jgi:transcriptional regulator with XRE-family HTH domain
MVNEVVFLRIGPGRMKIVHGGTPVDPDQAKKFGALIRRRRTERGLSTHELGRLVGTKNSTILRIEQGAFAAPRPDKLARIAEVLDMSLADVYAPAGYLVPTELPSFGAYLSAKYYELPEAALAQLNGLFEKLAARNAVACDAVPVTEEANDDVTASST